MADFTVFEVSSEAGRKVGGIYTVLRTKTASAIKAFGIENYFLFGFYDSRSAKEELAEEPVPEGMRAAFDEAKKEGIRCHYGRWTAGNGARLILVDAGEFARAEEKVPYGSGKDTKLNAIKYTLWKTWGIESLFMSGDFNENVLWSTAVGVVIEKLLACPQFRDGKVVCQFHEWISGGALLHLAGKKAPVAKVFTTHATVLGRSKTTFGDNLARTVEEGLAAGKTAPLDEAYRFKLEGKHLMEVACAKTSDAFTTVSPTVGREVEYILGKKPDVITLNGMDFSSIGELSDRARKYSREEIENLVHAIFLPQEIPKTDRAIFVYLTSRYEFENKGIDFFIDSLAKADGTGRDREIYAFIYVPSNVSGPSKQVLENLAMIDRMREAAEEVGVQGSLNEILSLSEKDPKLAEVAKLRKNLFRFDKPPVCVFDLNYGNDAILNRAALRGLTNAPGSRVKLIFYPTYLKAGDGLLNLEYDKVMLGSDAGIFPSRYEPFGYTPVEAAASGNIAITTDFSGFGRFLEEKFGETSARGIKVIRTAGKTDEAISAEIAGMLHSLAGMDNESLAKLKEDALEIARSVDWETQIGNYVAAYRLALERRWPTAT